MLEIRQSELKARIFGCTFSNPLVVKTMARVLQRSYQVGRLNLNLREFNREEDLEAVFKLCQGSMTDSEGKNQELAAN